MTALQNGDITDGPVSGTSMTRRHGTRPRFVSKCLSDPLTVLGAATAARRSVDGLNLLAQNPRCILFTLESIPINIRH